MATAIILLDTKNYATEGNVEQWIIPWNDELGGIWKIENEGKGPNGSGSFTIEVQSIFKDYSTISSKINHTKEYDEKLVGFNLRLE